MAFQTTLPSLSEAESSLDVDKYPEFYRAKISLLHSHLDLEPIVSILLADLYLPPSPPQVPRPRLGISPSRLLRQVEHPLFQYHPLHQAIHLLDLDPSRNADLPHDRVSVGPHQPLHPSRVNIDLRPRSRRGLDVKTSC